MKDLLLLIKVVKIDFDENGCESANENCEWYSFYEFISNLSKLVEEFDNISIVGHSFNETQGDSNKVKELEAQIDDFIEENQELRDKLDSCYNNFSRIYDSVDQVKDYIDSISNELSDIEYEVDDGQDNSNI